MMLEHRRADVADINRRAGDLLLDAGVLPGPDVSAARALRVRSYGRSESTEQNRHYTMLDNVLFSRSAGVCADRCGPRDPGSSAPS
jgi:hypothetical protein